MNTQTMMREQIGNEAADWFVRLQELEEGAPERKAFAEWLLRSPAHIEEYLAITRLWGDSFAAHEASKGELIRLAREEGGAPENVIQWSAPAPSVERDPARPSSPRPSRRLRYAAAASIMIAICGALVWFGVGINSMHLQTAIGEQRSLALPDGSIVYLNTATEVRVDFNKQQRRLVLERGEARFTVAKDTRRPFLVSTPQATVRALGTVFNVRTLEGRTAVTVIEGRVAVAGLMTEAVAQPVSTNKPLRRLELEAGEQAAVNGAGELLSGAGPSVEGALAWSDRRLIFREEPLSAVVAEFNRYHEQPLRISDPALGAIRISGSFHAGDVASLVEYLQRYESVQVRDNTLQLKN